MSISPIRRVLALSLVLWPLGPCRAQEAPDKTPLHIHAAGSLGGALRAIAARYQLETGEKIALAFGPSGLLREAIEKGNEADLFLSANRQHPERLAAEGKAAPPVIFIRNALCAAARADHPPTTDTLLDHMLDPATKIGTSTPKADPGGDYAMELFARAERAHSGAERLLREKSRALVGGAPPEPSPTQTGQSGAGPVKKFLLDGTVDLFIGYCSRRETRPDPDLVSVRMPDALAVRADYAMALLRDKSPERQAAAARFALYLMTPRTQAIFADYNFIPIAASSEP
ncbi:substrate-binding domain-containing protein [Methylosinus sp. H3A]|uniref:substrate-binding domain-containing protein n=1 Tax=Methylosinus sp. H3A TaxID=2785786 RepID=UPI0018C2147C|nr:substrate-binding domain-containing protein [Methylosinus sp. H3A]MBG0810716.1 substrate-binding domain-containing protein [Methylosinus sp. H3A]